MSSTCTNPATILSAPSTYTPRISLPRKISTNNVIPARHSISISKRRDMAVGRLAAVRASAEGGDSQTESARDTAVAGPQRVFVAGATGRTGQRVVRELVKRGVRVRAGVRSKEKGAAVLKELGVDESKVELVTFDITAGVDSLIAAVGADVDAVISAASLTPDSFELTSAWKIDNIGTKALVDASQKLGINRFILVSSLLTNGAAAGQLFNTSYLFLNLFGLVLVAKLQAERYIEKSGINYTIVRPGGLKNTPPSGSIVLTGADKLFAGSISRDQVADVVVEALYTPAASFKTVEIIAEEAAPPKSIQDLFAAV